MFQVNAVKMLTRISLIAKPFCERALQEDNLNVFAIIRFWMHDSTAFCLRHSRPYMLQWNQEVLHIQNKYILTKDDFTLWLRDELVSVEKFIEKDGLFGISLKKIGIPCELSDSMDSGDQTTPGYGPFFSAEEKTLDNEDSNKFLRALVDIGERGPVWKVGGHLEWDRTKSNQWLMNIHHAWQKAYCLYHCTPGLGGRGTEDALSQISNEESGSPRHIKINKGTCVVNANYHKGTLHTGTFKNIRRVLPYRVALLLFILVRVVRPVELILVLKYWTKSGEENIKATVRLYKLRLFASWGKAWTSDNMSTILMAWFKKGLGIPMGLRMY